MIYPRKGLLIVACSTELSTRDGTGSVTLTRDSTRSGTPVTRDPDWPGVLEVYSVQAYWPNLANYGLDVDVDVEQMYERRP